MLDALLLALALIAASAGLGWLALAMDVHWRQVRGSGAPSPRIASALRGLGVLGLLASLAICLRVDHASMAALVWIMALALAAAAVALLLAYRPRLLAPLVSWIRT